MLNTPRQHNCYTDCHWAETNQHRKLKINEHAAGSKRCGRGGKRAGVDQGNGRAWTRQTEMLETIAGCQKCVARFHAGVGCARSRSTQFARKPALAEKQMDPNGFKRSINQSGNQCVLPVCFRRVYVFLGSHKLFSKLQRRSREAAAH